MKKILLAISLSSLMIGCVTGGGYKPVSDNLPQLKVSFADPAWTGKAIPQGQHCQLFGGKGATPALKVENIPAGANAIIVEFNDLSFAPLSNDGGHGKIGYWVKGSSAVLISTPGETDKLPEGTFIESRARATGQYASPGYLPPCSGGKGNTYVAEVKAVFKSQNDKDANKLLATGKITLGSY